ncbi:DEAD/DEAH box helicase [Paenibacillus chartarius]|uniref:DEAD/DEAH box helicase n=1 Tax=Paenibacillus chartarius TaxID=747481 RepID=A0ABV6DJT7_9BACL
MKAALYAVRSGSANLWHWQTSICWEADVEFWRSQTEGKASLWLARSSLSFGQAEWLRQLLQTIHQEQPHSLPSTIMTSAAISKTRHPFPIPAIAGEYISAPMNVCSRNAKAAEMDDQMRRLVPALAGRQLLIQEVVALAEHHETVSSDGGLPARLPYLLQLAKLQGFVRIETGLQVAKVSPFSRFMPTRLNRLLDASDRFVWNCNRCGSGTDKLRWTHCPYCEQACPYCEECLTMGRVRACAPLVAGTSADKGISRRSDHPMAGMTAAQMASFLQPWGLSDAQAEASRAGLEFLAAKNEGGHFLIWAVTGAGKTEMMFPLLAAAVASGGRALVASPRKDVILELSPRVARAFPQARVVTLYGGSVQRWDNGEIVLATTHQLLRFREGFDVVVIDEMDAFPFHNNPMLIHAARKACRPHGRTILLSATPQPEMRRLAEKGRLPHVKVPARYHRHPLPVPQLRTSPSIKRMQESRKLPQTVVTAVHSSLKRGAQLFVFVPAIALVEFVVAMLRETCKSVVVAGTSSKDPDRAEKVQAFRDGTIRILVTTTILERGVTVPKSDVIVLDADSRLFDETSLVQMAGRAGRSKLDPAGNVTFLAKERSRSQVAAVRQIRRMNRLARSKGYIEGQGG